MTTRKNWGWIIGTGLVVGLLVLTGLSSVAFAHGPATPWQGWNPGGMMGSWGGMMNGWGGMMGGMMSGYGGMDPQSCPSGGWGDPGSGTPLTIDEAAARVEAYVAALNNPDLVLAEVMEFENNFYAIVKEESTGIGAFELLVNRYTGWVHPEPGPNMMWNTKYGHMAGWGGGMGGWRRPPRGEMTVTPEQARIYAQNWLDANLPGTTVADEVDAFYGYYTIHTLRDGEIAGMLSVNGYTGAVWYHTWHGDFIGMDAEDHD